MKNPVYVTGPLQRYVDNYEKKKSLQKVGTTAVRTYKILNLRYLNVSEI